MTTLGENLVLVVHDARGANLPNVATTLAMHTVAALVGKMAQREGSRFVFEHPTTTLTRHLLPDAGLRAPDTTGITLSAAGNASGVLAFTFARGNAPIDVDAATTLALESAMLVREGDDARFAGDLERARTFDLAALERAPRHSCVSRRIAEIDAFVGNRAEAALAILREADGKPALRGTLDGMLLRETGNVTSAIAELTHAAEQEQASVVSALTFAAAALATQDTLDAIRLLDAAVARAPRIAEIRWERARRRLLARHLADARADFQELEALAQGRFEREQVLRRGADMYRDAGLGAAAADLYERALLYRPDDPSALAGLGLALAREGRAPRGAALLARAIEIAKVRMQPTASMNLELARILGSELGDRPAAIARLAAIADDSPEATCGRGLEGHFRAILGDFAGASLAFARMRERCSGDPSAAPWLLEAATYEANRGELQAAHEHASRALAITPHDEKLLTFYKDLCARIEERARSQPAEPRPAPPAPPTPAREEPFDEGHAEERIEVLSRAVQADPTNDSVVDELAALLSKLGRSMELLALLSARIEDAPAERRQELLPKHRSVLRELERQARDEGRDEEARLFKMAYDASLAI
jgi:tetratricopeptide (TPR) repeat protein